MLKSKTAVATIAVTNLDKAREFYEGKLGLEPTGEQVEPDSMTYGAGNSTLFVYVSQFAGTNKATAVIWETGNDLEKVMDQMRGKGITFEHYDLPGATRKGDIHDYGAMKAAWFKDPDGNIHALSGN